MSAPHAWRSRSLPRRCPRVAPVARERIVNQPAASAYAYTVGSRVGDAYALAPMPRAVAATVPAVRSYRYMVINNRLLLVDPATGIVVAEVND
jgi:hypothetical protein